MRIICLCSLDKRDSRGGSPNPVLRALFTRPSSRSRSATKYFFPSLHNYTRYGSIRKLSDMLLFHTLQRKKSFCCWPSRASSSLVSDTQPSHVATRQELPLISPLLHSHCGTNIYIYIYIQSCPVFYFLPFSRPQTLFSESLPNLTHIFPCLLHPYPVLSKPRGTRGIVSLRWIDSLDSVLYYPAFKLSDLGRSA